MEVVKFPHHQKMDVCTSRAKYRQGRKFTAIKVYTINDESQHLIISHVPALGLQDELKRLCSRYGDVKSLVFIPNYEEEGEFTEAYHIQYARIQSAKFAKKQLDDKSFFGSVLHVCYAPEMESVDETRAKLIQRRKDVARKTRGQQQAGPEKSNVPKQCHRQKKHPALPITAERLSAAAVENAECIWQGIPHDIDPRVKASKESEVKKVYGPVKPDKKWIEAGVRERKIISLKKILNPHLPSSSQTNTNSFTGMPSDVPSISPSVLKLVPTQVKTARRIIFRNGLLKRSHSDCEPTCSSEGTPAALGSLSVEETILSVRKKIRAVGVPNIQTVLEKKN